MRLPRVYICSPFTDDTITQEKANRRSAQELSQDVARQHLMPINPLTMFGLLTPTQIEHADDIPITRKNIMRECFEALKRCDAIYLAPGWQDSKGCRKEVRLARHLGKVILPDDDALQRYAQTFKPNDV